MKKKILSILLVISLITITVFGLFKIYNIIQINNDMKEEKKETKYIVLESKKKFGVIDNKGNLIIEPKYTQVIIPDLSKPVFCCFDEEMTMTILNEKKEEQFKNYNKDEIQLIPGETREGGRYRKVFRIFKNNKYGLMSLEGKQLLKPEYDEIIALEKIYTNLRVKKDNKYGIVTKNGRTILPIIYNDISSANQNTWGHVETSKGYKISKMAEKGQTFGYATEKGKVLVKTIYEEIEKIERDDKNTYIIVQKNGQKGLYKNNKQIIPNIYQEMTYTKNNIILKRFGKYGLFDFNGKEVIAPRFKEYVALDNYVAFKENEKEYAFDEKGKQIGKGAYKILSVIKDKNYLITENFSGERKIVTPDKEIEGKFIDLVYLTDDKFMYYKNNKYGLVSVEKGILTEPKYSYISLYKNTSIIQAEIEDGRFELYSPKGEMILKDEEYVLDHLDNILMLQTKENKRYLNFKGEDIDVKKVLNLPAYSFKDEKTNKWGFKTKDGKVVVEPIYDNVVDFNKFGFASIKKGNKWGSINSEFKITAEPKYEFNSTVLPKFVGKYIIDFESYGFALEQE